MNLSVIIPTFNRFEALQNAVKSDVSQIDKNSEIIIINDGSTEENYYKVKYYLKGELFWDSLSKGTYRVSYDKRRKWGK